jgi:kynureninase
MAMLDSAAVDAARADALDAADPLRGFRERFLVADPDLVYLDGNSLGRLPLTTAERLRGVIDEEWGTELIRAWDHWLDMPIRVGSRLAASILGARPGEVIVSDSTTVNFYKLALAALEARPGRSAVVTDRANFPTDRYVLEGLARSRNLKLRWIDPDPIAGPQPADVAALLDDQVALVTLSLVNYRSAAIADLPAISDLARAAGAFSLWDLSHAAGAIEVDLQEGGADLAVGCTYKYLNAGPGSPAFLYVRSSLQAELHNPIQGWFGQREQFAMGPTYDRASGIRSWLTGTPTIPALVAVDEGVRIAEEAGIGPIRAKAAALTAYAIELYDAWLTRRGFQLGTPRDPASRGAHVALRHRDARRLSEAMLRHGVVTDFREPDSIRIGTSPLTTSYRDVWTGLSLLRDLAGP